MTRPLQAAGRERIIEVEHGIGVLVEIPGEHPTNTFQRARDIMSPVWSVWELDQRRIEKARTGAQWLLGLWVLFVAIAIAQGFWIGHLSDRLRESERLREEQLVAAANKIDLLEGQVAGKTRSLEEAHLANVAQYESLIECGCTPDRWQEFAGPETQRRDGRGGTDRPGAGPAKEFRLEAK